MPEFQAQIGNIIPQVIGKEELASKPIFDNKYRLLGTLGRKNNMKVYLCQGIDKPTERYALQVMSSVGLSRVQARKMQNEYENLHKLRHPNITRVWAFGKKGFISKPNKKTMANCLVYMRM